MFQKNTLSIPSDASGILLVKVIQTRRCSNKKHAKVGKFLKIVIKNTIPELLKKKKKKQRAIVIRSNHTMSRLWGLWFCFEDNGLVTLKKRMNTFSKEILGPTSKNLNIKKFKVAFNDIY